MFNLRDIVLAQALGGGSGGGSTKEWFNDGNTHIWITLDEYRKSPMLGVGVNGTVTVDWGDGTTPDVLIGTDVETIVCTPNHNYAKAGEYIITLVVDGEMSIKGRPSTGATLLIKTNDAEPANSAYQCAIRKVETGNYTNLGNRAFAYCNSLLSVAFTDSVTIIPASCFSFCYGMAALTIPSSVTSFGDGALNDCTGVGKIRFEGTTPPASAKQWYASLPADCIISVPTGYFDAYTSAANYPDPTVYTYIEEGEYDHDAPYLHPAGTIPDGATYTIAATGEVLEAGAAFPATVGENDSYTFGDYEYIYLLSFFGGWNASLNTKVTDKNQTSYSVIIESINGAEVVSLYGLFSGCQFMIAAPVIPLGVKKLATTFENCIALVNAPAIPSNITELPSSFAGCSSLVAAPVIPEGVKIMNGTFSQCSSLATASVIPSSVKSVMRVFDRCLSLTGEVEINGNISNTGTAYCFNGTVLPITITGTCSDETKAALAATATNGNVTWR